MTGRQEVALVVACAICIGVHVMVERIRAVVRDITDDYPIGSVMVAALVGAAVAVAVMRWWGAA